jgi:fructokinase
LCIFGEVLFDHFPDGKSVLGGAPFNVAWHLQAFGQWPFFISRVGADARGEEVRNAMFNWGMDTGGLQTDDQLPTGRVSIEFNDGEPQYDIVKPCAYDAIQSIALPAQCRLLYHGSLALRDAISRQTLAGLQQTRPGLVFVDVNLRPPWWQLRQVQDMVQQADWVKLNADELKVLQPKGTDTSQELLRHYHLQGLILTRGEAGAEVLTAAGDHFAVKPQASEDVVDTVGAGDAFASVMILGLANDWPLDVTLERAQAFASALVSRRGATVSDPAFYQDFINAWQLQAINRDK